MNNKRFISFILSLLMLVSTFVTPVQALSLKEKVSTKDSQELKGEVIENEEVFEFDSSLIPKSNDTIKISTKNENNLMKSLTENAEDILEISDNTFTAQRSPQATHNTEVSVTANGINGDFDWSILPNGFNVKFEYQTADKVWHEAVQNPVLKFDENNLSLKTTVNWPQDGTIEKGRVTTDFSSDYAIRVVATDSNAEGLSGVVNFDITIYEIPNTFVQVKYLDIYGKDLDSANLPTATGKELKTSFGGFTDITKTLPATSTKFNLRTDKDTKGSFDETDFNLVETLGFKIDDNTSGDFTVGEKKYKYTIEQKTKKDPTVVTIVYDADVAVPPMKDDGTGPVNPPTGYTRIKFDANENKQDGITGTHKKGLYAGKQLSYIDVKNGVQYDNANLQNEIKALSTTGKKGDKTYAQDTKTPWSPVVPDDTTPVTAAIYNAQYTKDIAEKIKEAGGIDPQDIVVWKDTPVANITWKDGTKLAAGVTDQTLKDAYANATFTEATVPARQTNVSKTLPGKIKVEFADGSSIIVGEEANKPQNLIVAEHKNEVTDPQNPPVVPKDAIEVEFKLGEGTKLGQKTGDKTTPVLVKTMLVKPDTTLVDADFPAAEKTNANAHDVVWAPDDKKVTSTNKTFIATSTKNVPTTSNADDYDPHYVGKSGKPGETVQIDKPTFTKKGETGNVQPPTGTTFAKKDNTQTNVTVDPNTGAITVKVPDTANPREEIKVPVVVTYPDKTTDEVTVTVTVTNPEDSANPTIDKPYESDSKITGKGEPKSKIEVELPDGTKIPGKVDDNGNWSVDVPADKPLKSGDTIKATQTDDKGKVKETTAIVDSRFKPQPIPEYNPWWPIWFGSTKTEVKKEEPKPLERHDAYISGYPDGTVRPDGKITRAEVSAIFARLTENSAPANYSPKFSDVRAYDWFSDSVMKLSKKDIIKGYPDGTFKPNKSITRAEFAVIASKYIKNPKAADETFSDVPMNHWAKDAIAMVKAEGWISGYTDGTFKPDAPITRAEAVSIVNRMFDRAADGEFVRGHGFEIKKFNDLTDKHWAYYEIMEAVHTHDYERIDKRTERWDKIVK